MRVFTKKYKALGFVEVLIALMVVGIACSVFLTIAGQSIKNLLKNEEIEYMSRIARDGANIAQEIANIDKADMFGEDLFPRSVGSCYIPIIDDEGSYKFLTEKIGEREVIKDVSPFTRENVLEYAKSYTEGRGIQNTYFRVMCIDSIETNGRWASVTFNIGNPRYAGKITNDKDLKDYTYQTIIRL